MFLANWFSLIRQRIARRSSVGENKATLFDRMHVQNQMCRMKQTRTTQV